MASLSQSYKHRFREPGKELLSPALLAVTLEISEDQLAAALGVHRNVLRQHPENPTVQRRLNDFAEVFCQLLELRSDPATAAFHMKNTPIRVLSYRTLFEAVAMHDSEKAVRYLLSISSGQSG